MIHMQIETEIIIIEEEMIATEDPEMIVTEEEMIVTEAEIEMTIAVRSKGNSKSRTRDGHDLFCLKSKLCFMTYFVSFE